MGSVIKDAECAVMSVNYLNQDFLCCLYVLTNDIRTDIHKKLVNFLRVMKYQNCLFEQIRLPN